MRVKTRMNKKVIEHGHKALDGAAEKYQIS
jgi:hypothetical protein